MTKHKISSDKPKEEKPDLIIKEKEIKLVEKVPKSSTDLKSYIQSGSKYVYIVAAAALVSGIFTPFTINADITIVIYGMLTIFLGLAGGILIFLATKYQKFRELTTLSICPFIKISSSCSCPSYNLTQHS